MKRDYKIVRVDNQGREDVAEAFVENIPLLSFINASSIATILCDCCSTDDWYQVVDKDYVLSRGMEDLV